MIETASRALLSLGCFVGVGAALMLPFTESGSGARIVSVLALLLGLGTVAGAVAARLLAARRHRTDAMTDLTDDDVTTLEETP